MPNFIEPEDEDAPELPDQPDDGWDEEDKALIIAEIRMLKIRLKGMEANLESMQKEIEGEGHAKRI